MSNSILEDVKKVLGLESSYDVFDQDVIMHINTALSTLTQLGVGPQNGFMINDASATWLDFLGEDNFRLNMIRSYVYLRVRLLFDPPSTSFAIESFNTQIKELEWRINVVREEDHYEDPLGAKVE